MSSLRSIVISSLHFNCNLLPTLKGCLVIALSLLIQVVKSRVTVVPDLDAVTPPLEAIASSMV